MIIALDAMGGDNAPLVTVEGALLAAKEFDGKILLVGNEKLIMAELSKHRKRYDLPSLNIDIVNTSEIITMDDHPAKAVRNKKDSSLAVCAKFVADKQADAFVSMGNSGASMAAALFYLKRIEGVLRPTIGVTFPTVDRPVFIADMGTNVDCKPEHLVQFAIMSDVYCKHIMGIANPKIALASIGEESTKGNELSLATYKYLEKTNLNFIGNIEGREIPLAKANIVICDGFVGNIILKFGEGLSDFMFKIIARNLKKHPIAWAAFPFLWTTIKDLKKTVDYSEFGAVPLLGVNGVCMIGHGRSNKKAVKSAILAANRNAGYDLASAIAEAIANNGNYNG
ncbi:MAG: phosphate acyltransferase PlsX [Elusimicrobiota bacterium]|jgi:glycerol-3-phosphate acyltransferase PlsX|nr:phosphate acyltransferase PlsX [Elusimicrobiota bacterium]